MTSKKALKVKGGFLPKQPAFLKRIGTQVTPRDVAGLVKYAASKAADPNFSMQESLKSLSQRVAVEAGKKVFEVIEEGLAGQEAQETIAESETTVVGRTNPSSTVGKTYRTKFNVGRRPTKTVNALAKTNGTTKYVALDTNTTTEGPLRESLTLRTGFNQKTIAAFGDASYWSMLDLETLTDAATFQRSVGSFQRAYWMTRSFGVKYKMMNRNKFNKMKVKVHFCRLEKPDFGPLEWFRDCFNTTLPTVATTNIQTIPYNLQLTDRKPALPDAKYALTSYCSVDPVMGSIRKSKIFEEVFTIQKTFSRWLDPGEVWELDYNHFTGPGLKLDSIILQEDSLSFESSASAFYYPIFEVVGPQVECYDSENGSNSYIGTCSGSIQFEMRKHCEIVQASYDPNNLYNTNDGYSEQRWAYRVYTDSLTSPVPEAITRRFNVDYENILLPGQVAAADKYVIPVTTDQQVVRGGKTAIAN